MSIPSIDILKIGVEAIQKMQEQSDRWDEAFQEMYDGRSIPTYYNVAYDAIVKIIEKTYNDEPGEFGSHISWWIWETDCGKDATADSVTDSKTGESIPMRTIEDVYNYYVKYHFKGAEND